MAVNLKELSCKPEGLTGGHRLCAGCGAPIAIRQVLLAADKPVIVTNATGCLEVATTIFPYTAWAVPFIHSAFENSAATASGLEAAYRSLRRQGKYSDEVYFLALGGDGGTYDIGLQALSGALERGHNFVYVCYDNQAYMNTGIQRSSATPFGADTTTTPCGSARPGKTQRRKDLTQICAAHGIPYAAQTTIANWRDVVKCAEKAFKAEGPALLNILAPCPRGWRYESDETVNMARLSRDTCVWPCYEIENGIVSISYKPKEKKPVKDWFAAQARFRHMLRPDNAALLEEAQAEVDMKWAQLQTLEAVAKAGTEAAAAE
ncbi:MAG TPA: thiamine pyrophosphate-dependent enzyme [Armatimonadota bacterium]|nr:thiamine pyrophosphate-dependent enzyme [Armatimonadota bacterium]